MTIIGLTGPSGAGKTTALQVLADMGAYTIDCDAVYHQLLKSGGPMVDALRQRFPGVVKEGRLDRKALGEIVFRDERALVDLNAITHSFVKEEVRQLLRNSREAGKTLAAVEAIALIESGVGALCTVLVGILAPVEERANRLQTREGISRDYAMARIKSQKPDSFFRDHCDYILENHVSDAAAFETACLALFSRLASS